MKIYLVVDDFSEPGKVWVIFHELESAEDFCKHYHDRKASVEERTLNYGQKLSFSGYIE